MIKVLFFASLRERLKTQETRIAADHLTQAGDVRRALIQAHPEWQETLDDSRLLVAVNQTMARPGTPVQDGDEVAFFPPVTGG